MAVLLAEARRRATAGRAGHGQRLFEDTPTYPLQLVTFETFKTGVLNLTYIPATG